MKLWRIKWEKIISIAMMITMTLCWIAFLVIPNLYTLAIAVLVNFMAFAVLFEYETIKGFRHDVINHWK